MILIIIKQVCLRFSVDISQSFGLLGVVLIWFLILMPIGVSLCADSVLVFELCLIILFYLPDILNCFPWIICLKNPMTHMNLFTSLPSHSSLTPASKMFQKSFVICWRSSLTIYFKHDSWIQVCGSTTRLVSIISYFKWCLGRGYVEALHYNNIHYTNCFTTARLP